MNRAVLRTHRAEFNNAEHSAGVGGALLLVKHRAAVLKLNADRGYKEYGGCDYKPEARNQQIH